MTITKCFILHRITLPTINLDLVERWFLHGWQVNGWLWIQSNSARAKDGGDTKGRQKRENLTRLPSSTIQMQIFTGDESGLVKCRLKRQGLLFQYTDRSTLNSHCLPQQTSSGTSTSITATIPTSKEESQKGSGHQRTTDSHTYCTKVWSCRQECSSTTPLLGYHWRQATCKSVFSSLCWIVYSLSLCSL